MNQTAVGITSALLAGLITVFGTAFVCACLISGGRLQMSSAKLIAYGCLSAGCLIASFIGARGSSSKKLIFGICPTACLLGCLFLLALCWKGQPIQPASSAAVIIICLLCAAVGSISGAAFRTKRK